MTTRLFFLTLLIPCLAGVHAAQVKISLEEVTDTCGMRSVSGGYFSFGDYDNDGDPDLLVNVSGLYRNDSKAGKIRFTDVTGEAGIKGASGASACWFDFDRDGWLDFGTRSGQVWINDGKGAFRNIGPALGIQVPHGYASAIAWGDIDGDGWLDLVTGGNCTYKPRFQHFRQTAWLNSRRKKPLKKIRKMKDVSEKVGIHGPMYGRSIVFCDYDWDGDDDVYSGNYHLNPNFLFQNEGGRFKDVAAGAGVTGRNDPTMFTHPVTGKKVGYRYGHTIGATWADLNNDGYFDLWVSNLTHKFVGKVGPDFARQIGSDFDSRGFDCDDSNLFINQGPPDYTFKDLRVEMGIPVLPIGGHGKSRGDELWSNAAAGDLDNNGWIDVFCNQVYGHINYSVGLLHANAGGRFTEVHKKAGVNLWGGYGAALADLDSDGRLDLVAGGAPKANGKKSVHVFRNRTRINRKAWIGFVLRTSRKAQAVGAKILVVQKKGVQLRQVATTMGSHTQQNDGRIHFGLGTGGSVVDVVIYWPDGLIQSLGAPRPGIYHLVKRSGKARKEGRITPKVARAGKETVFRFSRANARATYYWDFEGSRAPEKITRVPSAKYTYESPGRHTVWLRVTGPGGAATETRLVVHVKK